MRRCRTSRSLWVGAPPEQRFPRRFRLLGRTGLHGRHALHFHLRNAAAAKRIEGPATPALSTTKPTIAAVRLFDAIPDRLKLPLSGHRFGTDGAGRSSQNFRAKSKHDGCEQNRANVHRVIALFTSRGEPRQMVQSGRARSGEPSPTRLLPGTDRFPVRGRAR